MMKNTMKNPKSSNGIFPFGCRITALLLVLLTLLFVLTPVFIPKSYGVWATTAVMDGFYELEEDSIEVLFLGSSQIMTAVSPMQLYEETGITSYNLGTEQQNLVTSYFLLKEALQYQKPKVVVLDVFFLYPYYSDSALNSKEEFVRKAFDYMKWSPNKLEAVRTICSLDDRHELKNYFFPFLRFHSRWSDLSLSDFTYLFRDKANPLKGFSIATEKEALDFQGFTFTDSTKAAAPLETMEQYFEKIVSLCEENNISLVLIKTPRGNGSFGEDYHNGIQTLADKHALPFLDFNEKSLFDEIAFDASADYLDVSHVNYYGAEKITAYLSAYLNAAFPLEDRRSTPAYSSWQNDLQLYLEIIPK